MDKKLHFGYAVYPKPYHHTMFVEMLCGRGNNRETIAAIDANNDTYCFQNGIEKSPLIGLISVNRQKFLLKMSVITL